MKLSELSPRNLLRMSQVTAIMKKSKLKVMLHAHDIPVPSKLRKKIKGL